MSNNPIYSSWNKSVIISYHRHFALDIRHETFIFQDNSNYKEIWMSNVGEISWKLEEIGLHSLTMGTKENMMALLTTVERRNSRLYFVQLMYDCMKSFCEDAWNIRWFVSKKWIIAKIKRIGEWDLEATWQSIESLF